MRQAEHAAHDVASQSRSARRLALRNVPEPAHTLKPSRAVKLMLPREKQGKHHVTLST